MAETVLGGTIAFLNEIGVYDVILPFLLVFTIVFAILEKTKIFGVEKVGDQEVTRKNMNAMTAFVLAFFVIASSKLVALINTVASQAFLLVLLVILFLMLAGVLQKEGEYELMGGWKKFFMAVVFIILVLIFLNALGWLQTGYEFLADYWNTEAVSAIILIILIILFMAWISKSPKEGKKKEEKGDK
ncbi:MAG: hypothetical protein ISS25_02230 [Nanoarchaeota archaeon]|nr:hypothetical protein [DPANN group archaeon]MBL7116624.1 hypothetical protein [Nanoarchaeota archaeon]